MNTLDHCPAEANPTPGTWQFRLRSLMLLVAWIATGLGLMRAAAFLGILFTAATTPALVRTWNFTAQSNARGRAVDTPMLVNTFLGSLGIIVLITATTLFVALGAWFAASLLVLVVATSLCRFAAASFGHARDVAAWLLKWVMRGTARGAVTGRSLRRFRAGILSWPGIIGISLGVLAGACFSAGLLGIIALISLTRFVTDRLARLCGTVRWLLNQVMLGTAHLVAVDRRLLRRFRTP